METLLALFIVWLIVTGFGHLSWVVTRSIFRAFRGEDAFPIETPPLTEEQKQRQDIQAARRVLRTLQERHALEESTIEQFRVELRALETPWLNSPGSQGQMQQAASESPSVQSQRVTETPPSPQQEDDFFTADWSSPPSVPNSDVATSSEVDSPTPRRAEIPEPVPATPRDSSVLQRPVREPVESAPVLSRAEIIQSFLAAHNIRWGELVAGMLIVICSIGLVISLWSPLVETHRVLPSLIFTAANAAIYAAGLYTLSRWRLRDTSRAVLIIASLLVPLSVLAGMAAAGTSPEAVRLNDPITLGGIAVAAAVYLVLLSIGAKALVGQTYRYSLAAAVAGPVAVLPLFPAAVRSWQSSAGWLTVFASLVVMIAALPLARRYRDGSTMGPAGARIRLLFLTLAGFSLAVSVGYAAFALRGFENDGWMPLAVACVPAMVALAAMGLRLHCSARRDVQAMVGAIVGVLLISSAGIIFIPSLHSPSWLWSWAIALSGSLALAGWWIGQSRAIVWASVPFGLGLLLTSPMWISGASWSERLLWQRVIGGEPMLAALGYAAALGLISLVVPKSVLSRGLRFATGGWIALSCLIASLLSIGPPSLMGNVPAVAVTIILTVCAVIAAGASLINSRLAWSAVAAIAFTWLSIYHPFELPFSLAPAHVWVTTALVTAATLLVIAQASSRIASVILKQQTATATASSEQWTLASTGFSSVAATLAVTSAAEHWQWSAGALAISAGLLLWSWLRRPLVLGWHLCELSLFASLVVLATGRSTALFFDKESWIAGDALLAWSLLLSGSACAGLMIRDSLKTMAQRNTAVWLQRTEAAWQEEAYAARFSLDGCCGIAGVLAVMLSTGWIYADLCFSRGDLDLLPALPSPILATFAATVAIAAASWIRRFDIDSDVSNGLLSTLAGCVVVWIACAIGLTLPEQVTSGERLVTATSLAGLFSLAAFAWGSPQTTPLRRWSVQTGSVVGLTLLCISSSTLMANDWFEAIHAGEVAAWTITVPLAIWWATTAAVLLWQVKRNESESFILGSMLLVCAAGGVLTTSFVISWAATIQVATISLLVWILVIKRSFESNRVINSQSIQIGSLVVLMVGVISAVLATISTTALIGEWAQGIPSFLISATAVGLWSTGRLSPHFRMRSPSTNELNSQQAPERGLALPWPIAISLMAGQVAWMIQIVWMPAPFSMAEAAAAVALVGSIASLGRYRLSPWSGEVIHCVIVATAIYLAALMAMPASSTLEWFALAALTVVGFQTALVALSPKATMRQYRLAHTLQWMVVIFGAGLLVGRLAPSGSGEFYWTVMAIWSTGWILIWRAMTHDRRLTGEPQQGVRIGIADMDWAAITLAAVLGEIVVITVSGRPSLHPSGLGLPLIGVRLGCYFLVAASGWLRLRRTSAWTLSLGTLIGVVALLSVHVGVEWFELQGRANSNARFVAAALPASFVLALVAHWISPLGRWAGIYLQEAPTMLRDRLGQAIWQIATLVGGLAGLATLVMIADHRDPASAQMCTGAVALAGWAIAVTAESRNWTAIRHLAVGMGLSTLALLASIDPSATSHPLLTGSMRWLVAAVLSIPLLLFVFPKLLGASMSQRWYPSLRGGASASGVVSIAALITMLSLEASLRRGDRIEGIPLPLVIGVAIVLGGLSVLVATIAILSGPHSKWRERLEISDAGRRILIVLAQVIGAVTWLHVFLCRGDWAFLGLRSIWPYAVMGLAFVSVAVSEWARRMKDDVLYGTLAQTALYLPLIPVVGFWLSGSQAAGTEHAFDWVIRGEVVQYEWLLLFAAVYYLAVSALWKGVMPRIGAIVLGNAAWWVILVQQPGWGFLSHPQVWLIPPAACVLVAAHLYRDRLASQVTSAIRYAATLVIYISSTADMLLQEIGQTLSGPIILILLALLGMLAGVILRVRPFLYLGATFVFLGVTSMVWHAHRALDAVWPWWVFGITTGVLILAALMAIEKNKGRLRHYGETLASWQ